MHKEKYDDNFLVFFSKHYGDLKESHKKQHQEEEENRSHKPIDHDCNFHVQTDIVLNTTSISVTRNTLQIIEKTTNFYYQDKHSTFEKQKIFQPPRIS